MQNAHHEDIQQAIISEFSEQLASVILTRWHAGTLKLTRKEYEVLLDTFDGLMPAPDKALHIQIVPAAFKLKKSFLSYEAFYTFLCELIAQLGVSVLGKSIKLCVLEGYEAQRKNLLSLMITHVAHYEQEIEALSQIAQAQASDLAREAQDRQALKSQCEEMMAAAHRLQEENLILDALQQQLKQSNQFNAKLQQENQKLREAACHSLKKADQLMRERDAAHLRVLQMQRQLEEAYQIPLAIPVAQPETSAPPERALAVPMQGGDPLLSLKQLIEALIQLCQRYCHRIQQQFFLIAYFGGWDKARILSQFSTALTSLKQSPEGLTLVEIQKRFQALFKIKEIGKLCDSGQYFRETLRQISQKIDLHQSGGLGR